MQTPSKDLVANCLCMSWPWRGERPGRGGESVRDVLGSPLLGATGDPPGESPLAPPS